MRRFCPVAAPFTTAAGFSLSRQRYAKIVRLGLPVIGGMVSQNVLNLVDTAMVGSLGDAALAAVGTGSFCNFMAVALLTGLSAGVQAMVARRFGERSSDLVSPLVAALALAVVLSIPLILLVYPLAPGIFGLLNTDPEVLAHGVPYLRIRLCAAAFVGMNFSFRGYWNAINRPAVYMRTLIVMHVVNIALNWLLIFGHLGAPQMGASGAALASVISIAVGTLMYFAQARVLTPGFRLRIPRRAMLAAVLRLSIPNGVQQLLFASGYTVLFGILGRVGTAETAAANVLINVMLVAILPGLGLGIASASLVGQALGRKDPADAKLWGWQVARVGVVFLMLLGLPMLLLPGRILGVFLHDPETLELARLPLQLMGATIWLDAVGMVLSNALIGAGATRTAAVIIVGMQWLLFLPGAWLAGPVLGYGLLGIWVLQVGYRGLQSLVVALVWQRGRWALSEL